jgi:hypothetical protein
MCRRKDVGVMLSPPGWLFVAGIFGAPLLASIVGLIARGRVPDRAVVVALIAQAVLLALLILRFATLPGDHYYADRSACRTANSSESLQLYGLFWASVAAWASSGFTNFGSNRLVGAKLGLSFCACVGGLVALYFIARYALCDPS